MFIYNKCLKYWDEHGFTFLFACTILFFFLYWLFFTRKNRNGTYNKIDLTDIKNNFYGIQPPLQTNLIPKKHPPKCSKGETECRRVLEKIFKLPFPNVRPDFLKNIVTGENLELDMFNPNLKLACEYHGKQHYEFNKWMHKSQQNFQNQQYRDIMKRDICKKLNINLIEVPYTIKICDIEDYIISKLKILGYFK